MAESRRSKAPPPDASLSEGRAFQRTIEDFSCAVCKHEVQGNGYTNHCPRCLWSVHVDVNPGDRKESCRGLMRPVAVEVKGGERLLTHECSTCGKQRRIRLRAEDSMDAILRVMQGLSTTD